MKTFKIDLTHELGPIKPLHGVGQPPFNGVDFSKFHYLTEAGIPFSRLHDVSGYYGGYRYVDIPNLFRNFDADPEDPRSYDFSFTDLLMEALNKYHIEPFFRLGVTIENNSNIKAYRIFPPADPKKWAIVCEHVIRHYTEGWADGHHYSIRYWEIWNEPENPEMWQGSMEEYFELYKVTSKHLKSCFPHLKIGGYASCGFYAAFQDNPTDFYRSFLTWFDEFLKFAKAEQCPLDFFSWHSYDPIESTVQFARYAREKLDLNGFADTETSCNEWNPHYTLRGTLKHTAEVTGMMLAFQNEPVDTAMFYDARFGVSEYGGIFNPLTGEPFPAYYGFKAFNELYKRKTQVALETDAEGIYAVAAKGDDSVCIVISNPSSVSIPFNLELDKKIDKCYLLDKDHLYEEVTQPKAIGSDSVLCIIAK